MIGMFGEGFEAGLAGPAAQVADALRAFERYGVDRVTLVELVPGSFDLLAPALL
jgi:hypothetical protein